MSDVNDMEMTMGTGTPAEKVPAGIYETRFLGIENAPAKEHNGKMMDPAIVWRFEITAGPETGKRVDNYGNCRPQPTNISGKILAGLAGTLPGGKTVKVKDFVGKAYRVVVAPNKGGRNVVTSVFPV